uniref:Uncharacterized protein n=1 Tax=Cyprinus carpio TaxID=7962 RepID=A0A8C1G264_CYPCA
MDDYTSALQIQSQLCVFFSSQGFFKEAESDFQRALELNPNFKDAKESLNQTLLDRSRKDEERLLMRISHRILHFSSKLS